MKNIKNKNKNYIILILLVLIFFSCLYSISVSNGMENIVNSNLSNESNHDVILDDKTSEKRIVNMSHIVTIIGGGGEYIKKGSNESDNVILNFKLSPANDPHFGGVYRLWIDLSLYYKNNNTSIPNQTIYMITGNETFVYKTNENGKISEIFEPRIYGNVFFQFLFNGSKILDNGSMIDLEPVSLDAYYFLKKDLSIYTILPPSFKPIYMDQVSKHPFGIDLIYSAEDIKIEKSDYDSVENKNTNENKKCTEKNYKIAYGKMKESGIPLIQLVLVLIAILGIIYKKN